MSQFRSVCCETRSGLIPSFWAVHDYDDPSSGVANASGDISSFTYKLAEAESGLNNVWITESAVNLTDSALGDLNRSGCPSAESDDNGKLAACVDGDPTAQATGAQAFLSLPAHGYLNTTITIDMWYEFQPANASSGFDSGLLAPPQPQPNTYAQLAPDGVYGNQASYAGMRQSYCVVANLTPADCTSSTAAASHWSLVPHSVTGHITAGQTVVTNVVGSQSNLPTGSFVTCSLNAVACPTGGIQSDTRITAGIGTATWYLSLPATYTGNVNLTATGMGS